MVRFTERPFFSDVTVKGISSIIEKKRLFLLPLNILNYIAWFRRYHYLKAGLPFFYSLCICKYKEKHHGNKKHLINVSDQF